MFTVNKLHFWTNNILNDFYTSIKSTPVVVIYPFLFRRRGMRWKLSMFTPWQRIRFFDLRHLVWYFWNRQTVVCQSPPSVIPAFGLHRYLCKLYLAENHLIWRSVSAVASSPNLREDPWRALVATEILIGLRSCASAKHPSMLHVLLLIVYKP